MSNIQTENQKIGTFGKIYNIFFSPRITFESVDEKPDWLVPMTIVVIVALIFGLVAMPVIMPEKMAEQRLKLEERGMSPQEIDRAMEMGEKFGKRIAPVGAIVGTVIYLTVVAGIFLFIGNIILGGKTSFKKMLSVVCYSSLIGSLGSLILLPLVLSKQTMDVHFSLAAVMSSEASKTILYQFLKKIDLFAIWQIFVAGIGVSAIYKFTTQKSVLMVASLYVVYILISLVWFSIF